MLSNQHNVSRYRYFFLQRMFVGRFVTAASVGAFTALLTSDSHQVRRLRSNVDHVLRVSRHTQVEIVLASDLSDLTVSSG